MTSEHDDPDPHPLAPPPPPRRRLPVWMLVVGGLAVAVLIGGTIALITNNRPEPVSAEDVVVTLPAPSPTLQPVERSAATAFAQGLPSEVLQFALVEEAPEPALLVDGALEGHRLTYSDGGGTDLVVLAGQWRDADTAATVFATRLAELQATAAQAPADDAEATEPRDGPVQVDGEQVGAYAIVPLGDGTGTALWHNGTAVVEVTGPAEVLGEFFTAFPL